MNRVGSQFRCVECGEDFVGPESFDRHFRRDTAQCQTPTEMRYAGMAVNTSGFWFISRASLPPDFGFEIGFANGGPGEAVE
jgi:hypothetical protein